MVNLKHVGRIKATGKKCLIAFRTLPGDAYSCLIIPTENLQDDQHDSLIQLVESPSGQSVSEFAEALSRAKFPDGSTMLPSLHATRRLIKVPTDQVLMTPNFQTSVSLAELNQIIAEQKGVAVDELALRDDSVAKKADIIEVAQVKDMMAEKKDDNVAKTTSASVNDSESLQVPTGGPDEVAKFYRSQADKLAKQAAEFRRKAEDLVPTKKKSG
jgi:hypothetical protein